MNKAEKSRKLFRKIREISSRGETLSVFFIVIFLGVALSSMFVSPRLYQWSIHEGDVALKNVYAPYDFTYFREVDEEGTEKARQKAAISVPFMLSRDFATEEKIRTEVDHFFTVLREEKQENVPTGEKIAELKTKVSNGLSERNIKSLLEYPDVSELKDKTLTILENVFLIGYIDRDDLIYLKSKGALKVAIYDEEAETELERTPDDLLDEDSVTGVMENYASAQFEGDRRIRQAVIDLLGMYLSPNLKLDEVKTEREINNAVKKVKPLLKSWTVKKNELIIEKGKRVNAHHIAQIAQLRRIFRPGTTPTFFLGVLLLFLLLGLIAAIYLFFTQKTNFLKDTKDLVIVLLVMLGMIVIADIIMSTPQPSYFIPMAGMGMIIALLVGFNVAFLSVFLMCVLISLLVGGKIEVTLVLMVGSAVGMFAVRDTRRRAQILWAGILAGVAKLLAISCIGLINGMELDFYVKDGIWCLASGLFSGFIVMGLLPVFEHFFKVPTNISLLELSDMNHPLLKKLAMNAPGTYHHSIMVGNLAEAACDAIGANSLLARVGAYYHDIGKIPKAEYFSENEMGGPSKHSNLAPSMSALIIAKHIKEGVEIARKYKLNRKMIDFITQHHGDGLISFFYQKAMEKSEDGTVLDEDNFRYPGPKPQTKESAIILLADSVEASSRTLADSTPSSIRNLVRKIINNKFIDGQLDECDLTLKDMHKIAESFVRILMGTFHTRLDYPEDKTRPSNEALPDDTKNKQRKSKQKNKN
ncbi:MAG: HDIG domain-containing protein [Candidatus Omnitrophota bacterium]|nr:HDIG domain-containing protein [Candidatus Omnitrophota bacterium]